MTKQRNRWPLFTIGVKLLRNLERCSQLVRVIFCCVLLLQTTTIQPEMAVSQPVGEAATLKFALDQLQATLDSVLNTARNNGVELGLVLGDQITAEIDLARQELHTELDYQRAQWSATAAALVDNITQSIQNLKDGAFAQAQDLINQTQLIALTLPFSNRTAEVRSFSPVVVARPPSGVEDVVFTVAGLFPDLGEKGFEPYLKVGSTTYPAVSPTAFSAQFHIPKTHITFPTGGAIDTQAATLVVPFKTRCWVFFHCKNEASFPELIGLLPPSPGHLHLSITNVTQQTQTTVKTSNVIHQDASGGDDRDHPQTWPADSGWEIDPYSVHVTVLSQDGDSSIDFNSGNCSTRTFACWKVTTIQHHCAWFICPQGHDGSMNIRLSFTESRTVNVQNSIDEDVELSWGDTTVRSLPTDGAVQWAATYTDFNGQRHPFGSSDSSVNSPYLKVNAITSSCLAFAAFPFSVNAGADLSVLAADPKAAPVLARLQARFGVDATASGYGANLNPLTRQGFRGVKVFAARALAATVPAATVPSPVGPMPVGGRVSGLVPPQISTPTSPQQRALNALQMAALASNDTM